MSFELNVICHLNVQVKHFDLQILLTRNFDFDLDLDHDLILTLIFNFLPTVTLTLTSTTFSVEFTLGFDPDLELNFIMNFYISLEDGHEHLTKKSKSSVENIAFCMHVFMKTFITALVITTITFNCQ